MVTRAVHGCRLQAHLHTDHEGPHSRATTPASTRPRSPSSAAHAAPTHVSKTDPDWLQLRLQAVLLSSVQRCMGRPARLHTHLTMMVPTAMLCAESSIHQAPLSQSELPLGSQEPRPPASTHSRGHCTQRPGQAAPLAATA